MAKRKKWSIKAFTLKSYQKEALATYLKPPEQVRVSEWAERHRMLDSKTSAIPGQWRNSLTPYLIGIMDEFDNYYTEHIIFCKPTQVGGSEALINMILKMIAEDPAPSMVVYPTETLAKSISENRLQPAIRLAAPTKKVFHDTESQLLELQFDGMYLSLAGSNSPSGLASKACKYLFLDEVDKYPGTTKREADPIKLAEERTKTYHNRKIYITSTPTLADGHIWKSLQGADVERHYFVPCPHCGEYIELKFAQIRFPDDDGMTYQDRAELAVYVCQQCGAYINDADKPGMLRNGEWRDVRKSTKTPRKVGFWINTLYSPFVRFSQIAAEFLASKDDPEKLQNFVNSWLAEPWENTRLKTSADMVLERQTEIPQFVIPEWAKLLTGGVDVQENCLYWSIRAFGAHLTSQNIAHGQVLSFAEIEDIMNAAYETESGEKMAVNLCLIDSGYDADSTYDFCIRNSDWAYPVKGASNPMANHYKISKVNKAGSKAEGITLIITDGDKYKDMIAARMAKENGRGSWMVYSGCDREYAEQVTAEHKVNIKTQGGKTIQRWVPKHSHADNHYLDTEVYALAAADLLNVRALYLQEEKAEPPAGRQENPPQNDTPEETWINQNELNGWIG